MCTEAEIDRSHKKIPTCGDFLELLESHDCLDMVRMWEHIHRSDISDLIENRGDLSIFSFFLSCFPDEYFEITSKCSRIARDIDDLTSTK